MEKLDFFRILPINAEKEEFTIVCGTMQATPKTFKTMKDAQAYIKNKPYDLIFTLALAAVQALKNKEESEKMAETTVEKKTTLKK